MEIHRIYAYILRHLYLFRHSLDRFVDVFYWPTIDLILWGITSLFINSLDPNYSQFVIMIVSGLVFWQAVWRGQVEITVSILEELWNKNFINLFITPLKFSEWLLSYILLGIMKLIATFIFISGLAYCLYKVNIWSFGMYIVPFVVLLLMTGWWIGILIGSAILRFGTRVQNLAWSFVWGLSPFFAIFYPVSILPAWAQKISYIFPASYIFEGIRNIIRTGQMDNKALVISFILNLIYLAISLIILKTSFNRILKKGLIKIY